MRPLTKRESCASCDRGIDAAAGLFDRPAHAFCDYCRAARDHFSGAVYAADADPPRGGVLALTLAIKRSRFAAGLPPLRNAPRLARTMMASWPGAAR